MIAWTLEIPTAGNHPDEHLAALLDRITDGDLQARTREVLARLRSARDAVAAAPDASQLDAALARFEDVFAHAANVDSTRASGQSYAGRTALFEDCRRDLDVTLGRPILDRLAAPLALVLQSARWFTFEIAARYRRALGAIYREVAGGERAVDFAKLWEHVPALFPGAGADGSIAGAVRDELQQRWAGVLAVDHGARQIDRRARDLAQAVAQAFAAPHPGWPSARHHSPDILIAAAGPEAFARGDARIVIGELHTGYNTFLAALFAKQHPAPDELVRARDADLDHVGIAPVWSKAITRADYYSPSPRDVDLENGVTKSARPRSQVVTTAELVVTERDGFLDVQTRDGRHVFDIIAFLEHHLIAESYAAFSPLAPAAHSPRVMIDDVVIARESWRIEPAGLAWIAREHAAERFVEARRWARELGLPRRVFVKTVGETKPVFLDFASTVLVEIVAKLLRGSSAATISEMLPSLDELWVEDAAGERYTAELRLAAVDPTSWRAQPCL